MPSSRPNVATKIKPEANLTLTLTAYIYLPLNSFTVSMYLFLRSSWSPYVLNCYCEAEKKTNGISKHKRTVRKFPKDKVVKINFRWPNLVRKMKQDTTYLTFSSISQFSGILLLRKFLSKNVTDMSYSRAKWESTCNKMSKSKMLSIPLNMIQKYPWKFLPTLYFHSSLIML